MNLCKCNENCYKFEKIYNEKKENKEFLMKKTINKCNKLLSDNTKKKPCDYYDEKIEILYEIKNEEGKDKEKERKKEKEENKKKEDRLKENLLSRTNLLEKLDNMLKSYNLNCSNYFGNLNQILIQLNYEVHLPYNESLSELKIRLKKRGDKKNRIYLCKESILSETVGEYNYDYEIECYQYDNIINKKDVLEWTKDEEIKKILELKKRKVKKKKNKSKEIKKLNKKLNELEIEDSDKDEIESDKEKGSESENESSESESEGKKDDEFDVEIDSDIEEIENEEYDDFSD